MRSPSPPSTPSLPNAILLSSPTLPSTKHAFAAATASPPAHAHTATTESTRRMASVSRLQHTPSMLVSLPTCWFRLVWVATVGLQLAVAVAIERYGSLFAYFATDGMTYYVHLLGLVSSRALGHIARFLFALALWHVLMVARTLYASLCARRLAFTHTNAHIPNNQRVVDSALEPRSWLSVVARASDYVWYDLFGRRGVFGVESPAFELLFVVREVVEIGSQTYQTYRLTHLVARPWLTNISTLLVLCNCVSTPVLRRWRWHLCGGWGLQTSNAAAAAVERALCLAIDVVLDMCASIVIPLTILWPYVEAFDPETIGFADALLFDDVWQVRALMENRQLYMTSSLDCFSKVVPFVSMLSSFNGIGKLVQEQRTNAVAPATTVTAINALPPASKALAALQKSGRIRSTSSIGRATTTTASARPLTDATRGTSTASSSAIRTFVRQRAGSVVAMSIVHKTRANRFVDGLFIVWAVAVAIVHLVAIQTSYGSGEAFGCRLSTRPWLSTRFSCAVLELNCYRHFELHGGTAIELSRVLNSLESGSLASLIVSHCPALSMPSELQRFSQLLSMELYNSTIVSWPASASLCAQHHTSIGLLTIVRCNMAALPDGVLVDLPPTLTDVSIIASNLTTLPHDLEKRWPAVASLLLEQGVLTHVPPAIGRMTHLVRLSLVGNAIATIDDDVFVDTMGLFAFALSGNPLTALPTRVGRVNNFKTLYLDHTHVEELPAWATSEAFLEAVLWITAHGTPLCPQQARGMGDGAAIAFSAARAAAATTARVQELLPRKVRCSPEKNRIGGFYPLEAATARRVP